MIREFLGLMPTKTLPKTVGSRSGYAIEKIEPEEKIDFRTYEGKKKLYIMHRRDPLAWRVVKILSALSVARGFKLIPTDEEAATVIKKFLFRIHRVDPVTALLVKLQELTEDASWSGGGWWERLYSKKWEQDDDPYSIRGNEIVGLKKIHPLTMDYKRDLNSEIVLDTEGKFGPVGEFLAYTQTLEDRYKSRDIDKRRVCHLAFNKIGDELLGVSDIEPLYKTRHRGMQIEDAIAQGAYRHGVPFLDVEVGDDQHYPDDEMMAESKEQVKNSSYMSEYVHPPWYKVKMFEQFSLAKSEGMLDPYINLVAAATGIPRPLLLGSGEGTNKATIKELINMLPDLVVAPRQKILKHFLEEQVLAPLMKMHRIDAQPYVQWNELFPPDATIITKMKILSDIKIEEKPLITWIEAREMIKMPAQEERTIYSLSASQRGIYLVEPHGNLIYEGMKKSIVTKKSYPSMVGIPLVLISGKKAYGKIKLEKPTKINLDDFKKYQNSHRISDEEREEWWSDAKEFYLWKFKIIEMFKKTKKVKVPQGVQKFISNVEFLSDENALVIES